jgi:hypothetical protein
MPHPFFFFFISIILFLLPVAHAETIRAYLLAEGEKSLPDDEIIFDENQSLDLSSTLIIVPQTSKKVGEVQLSLSKEIKFFADKKPSITLKNTSLPNVSVNIPNLTKISAPASWNGIIIPPKSITTLGTVPAGFQTPITSISVGSPDVILVFDKAVIVQLEGITGQTAYKTPGSDTWLLISTCLGTYDTPIDPPVDGECSISNGVDTKIVTFHFTEFTGLTTTPTTPPTISSSISSSNSGGGGSGRSTGPSSTSTAFAGRILPEGAVSEARVFPNWFQSFLVYYWIEDSISDDEFKNAINYMLNKNIIKIDVSEEKNTPLLDLAPSIKPLFKLWVLDKLSDSAIIKIVSYYRTVGVW